jgi:hypothetical protein
VSPAHIDIDELAEAAEGLVGPERAEQISRHVAQCETCSSNAEALSEVRHLLETAPAEIMPDDVFARLQGALSSEQQQREDAGHDYYGQSPSGRSEKLPTTYKTETGGPTITGGGRYPKPPLAESFAAKLPRGRRLRARFAGGALAGALLASSAGLGGYVLSASAGTDEPPADHPVVISSERLAEAAAAEAQRGKMNAHRFSRAWQCVKQVTDGRVDGIRTTVMDGQHGYLVILRENDQSRAVFITGCDTDNPRVVSSAKI